MAAMHDQFPDSDTWQRHVTQPGIVTLPRGSVRISSSRSDGGLRGRACVSSSWQSPAQEPASPLSLFIHPRCRKPTRPSQSRATHGSPEAKLNRTTGATYCEA